jgi:hypothetical protein
MDAKPVIPNGIDRDHVSVVFEFVRERVRQPREPAIVHSHCKMARIAFAIMRGKTSYSADPA